MCVRRRQQVQYLQDAKWACARVKAEMLCCVTVNVLETEAKGWVSQQRRSASRCCEGDRAALDAAESTHCVLVSPWRRVGLCWGKGVGAAISGSGCGRRRSEGAGIPAAPEGLVLLRR